ncbi:MAG: thioesterase [Ruminococcaceae bacterium]|nr:thioesterase [Oscillospiraceae bacterium]
MIEIGVKGRAETIVTKENTAAAMGSGTLDVFATPAMIALMEKTAAESVQPLLEEGQTTVGTAVDIRHTAATPLGMQVTCNSLLVSAEGRMLVFEVIAEDEAGEIGRGRHERFIITADRFMEKTNNRGK